MTTEGAARTLRFMRSDYGPNKVSLRLAVRPFVDMFQFRGRSTRTEVLSFWFLNLLPGLIQFTVDVPPSPLVRVVGFAWTLLWSWPWVPLLVRRLHDQDRSVWWLAIALALPAVITLALLLSPPGNGPSMSVDWGVFRETKRIAWTPISIITMIAAPLLAISNILLLVWPNTAGTNRYGPDPRLETAAEPKFAET